MARTFVRASSQYCEASSVPSVDDMITYTLAGWYKPSSIAGGTILGLGDTNSGRYIALGMGGDGKAFFEVGDPPTSTDAFSTGTLTNGSWNHIAGVSTSSTNRVCYLGGVAGTADTTTVVPTGLDTTTVGALWLQGERLSFAGGDIGEVALWNTALSGANISSLAGGALPSTIPTGLVGYWKITGTDSPELDSSGQGRSLTVVGATAAGSNPPVTGGTVTPDIFVRVAGAWIAVDRKVRVGGAWV